MTSLNGLLTAAASALAVNLLPWLLLQQSQMQGLNAAWGWSTVPKCVAVDGVNWTFKESEVLAGTAGEVQCNGAGQKANPTHVLCKSSDGLSPPDNGWWQLCGPGIDAPCADTLAIGEGVKCEASSPPPSPSPTASPSPSPSPTVSPTPSEGPASSDSSKRDSLLAVLFAVSAAGMGFM
eukprot:TRINITY_DN55172_c0_g1_i1.p1 TRINITY_DN55172_c0_g1~~TRINITY_DN55172_c0_g1_i1.p1  ORF type:complete len:179 (+),score=22.00 TRINITY_DN55172_c0_g1_i1:28-564(+)